MNWKQHLFIGILFEIITIGFLTYYKLLPELSILYVLATFFIVLVSPLIPDLDSENGKLQHSLIGFGLFSGLIGLFMEFFNINYYKYPLYFGLILASVVFFNADYAKHRGFQHSLIMNIIYGAVLFAAFDWVLALIGFVGFWSHLLADKIPFKVR